MLPAAWGVVVPVKRLAEAKTRLTGYGDDARQELALAFALDVVSAVLPLAWVLVVTDDERAGAALAAVGARVVRDDPDAGLNPALAHGADLLRADDDAGGVATVAADLPALRTDDLRSALAAVGGGRGFVPDLGGGGTTVLAAGAGAELRPAFGPSSRAAHLASGAHEVAAVRRVRRDVDTAEDLLGALALGTGQRTAAVARSLGITVTTATVSSWEPEEGGVAHAGDGRRVALAVGALDGSGLRLLRAGQRIRVARDHGGRVAVSLP